MEFRGKFGFNRDMNKSLKIALSSHQNLFQGFEPELASQENTSEWDALRKISQHASPGKEPLPCHFTH